MKSKDFACSNIICLKNVSLVLEDSIRKNSSITIRGTKIELIHNRRAPLKVPYDYDGHDDIIDAKGWFVSPGFIDTHIHGDPAAILSNEIKFGTTGIVIAESCAPQAAIFKKIDKIGRFIKNDPLGRCVLGVRLEGPYISKTRAGAQDKRYIRKIGTGTILIKRCGKLLKMVTIAPELKGAIPLIGVLKRNRIIPSIGHTDATYEIALGGIDAGITHATHIFNAMSGEHKTRRQRGVSEACLDDDRVMVEVIADLVHVKRALLKKLFKTKPLDKIILITDSIRAIDHGLSTMDKGVYRLSDGTIAGSSLTMIGAVKAAVISGGLSLPEAIRLASLNPARLLGLENSKGSIAPGKDADLVIFDRNFKVKMVMVRGKIITCAE